jgi:DNA-binding transcriptional MerR regulator
VGERSYLSIGDVLTLLREEFPDITISKIRFLESRGLLVPERTPSGYRKFYDRDVERLRWILRQQREHFLPLKVIKGRLEGASESGEAESLFDTAEPPPSGAQLHRSSRNRNGSDHPSVSGGAERHQRAVASNVTTIERAHEMSARSVGSTRAARQGEREARPEDTPEEPRPGLHEVSFSASEVEDLDSALNTKETGTAEKETSEPPAPEAPSPPGERPHQPRGRRSDQVEGTLARGGRVEPRGRGEAVAGSLTPSELAQASGLSLKQVEELESYGLIEGRTVAGVRCFNEDALKVATLSAGFAGFGIEPRHLRLFKHAAERQSGLYSQVVMPVLRQRNPEARTRAHNDLDRLSDLGRSLQEAFVQAALRGLTGG